MVITQTNKLLIKALQISTDIELYHIAKAMATMVKRDFNDGPLEDVILEAIQEYRDMEGGI